MGGGCGSLAGPRTAGGGGPVMVGEGGHWAGLYVENGTELGFATMGATVVTTPGTGRLDGSLVSVSISNAPPMELFNLASSNACFLASRRSCAVSPLSITLILTGDRGSHEISWHRLSQ